MEMLFEVVVDAYRRGEKITLEVGERGGYVVIGLTVIGDPAGPRVCIVEPGVAKAVVDALEKAIVRADAKGAS